MFRRLFWLLVGIVIGVWGTTKVNRAARRLTPQGLAETAAGRVAELGGQLRRFAEDVRTGMTEREQELGHARRRGGRTAAREAGVPGQRSGAGRSPYDRKPPYDQKEGH